MTYKTEPAPPIGVDTLPRRPAAGARVRSLARNAAANVVRIGLTSLIAIFLPVYLTHRLSVQVYGAWVLILQLGAYVGYLNLGVQTALAKFIAEYRTREDDLGCAQVTSVGFLIMLAAGVLGMLLTCLLVVLAPRLFSELAPDLLYDVRISTLLVGLSLSVGLTTSVFSAIFLGLQRYHVPMVITVASRFVYALFVCGAVALHCGLVTMAIVVAAVNLLTSLAEVIAWRRLAGFISVSFSLMDIAMLKRMVAYCSILTVWSACMLFIGGFDLTIVAHYDFHKVAFYSIASSPTNLILLLIGAVMGPLLPAASALSVTSNSQEMGHILLRTTRYSTIILLTTGLPLIVGGYLLLRLWVGPMYAMQSVMFLHVLLLANIIRNLCGPYATIVVATSRQRVATASAITEALVNLGCSIYLAQHLGAIGVALGTLIGAVAGVALHFAISMHYTQQTFALSRFKLFLGGMVIPAAMAIPSIVLVPFWWNGRSMPAPAITWTMWLISTIALAWFVSFTAADRKLVAQLVARFMQTSSQNADLNID